MKQELTVGNRYDVQVKNNVSLQEGIYLGKPVKVHKIAVEPLSDKEPWRVYSFDSRDVCDNTVYVEPNRVVRKIDESKQGTLEKLCEVAENLSDDTQIAYQSSRDANIQLAMKFS